MTKGPQDAQTGDIKMVVALPGRPWAGRSSTGRTSERRHRHRRHFLATTDGLLTMLSAAPALAQDADAAPEASQIIVTVPRIMRDGYRPPPPAPVLRSEDHPSAPTTQMRIT